MTTTAQPKIFSFVEEIQNDGSFKRTQSAFRDFIKADGSSPFKPESNRYHIYISYACPWASRCTAVLRLKGLEDVISYSAVHWLLERPQGWKFSEEYPDPKNSETKLLKELYLQANPNYTGKITVPVLWDTKLKTIVSNESSEIIRMLNTEFNEFAKNPSLDLYPESLRAKIDEVNAWTYDSINNGVYKAGFASKQGPYEEAYDALFAALDKLEELLSKQRYLTGSQLTEADVRLFTTLIRFDAVYHGHFKCNKKKLIEYPNIWAYTRDIYQTAGVADTVDFFHIKNHYYQSHVNINPTQVVPKGPVLNLSEPHGREQK